MIDIPLCGGTTESGLSITDALFYFYLDLLFTSLLTTKNQVRIVKEGQSGT